MALASLLDCFRQWVTAHLGVEVDQAPREYAFCEHALRADAVRADFSPALCGGRYRT